MNAELATGIWLKRGREKLACICHGAILITVFVSSAYILPLLCGAARVIDEVSELTVIWLTGNVTLECLPSYGEKEEMLRAGEGDSVRRTCLSRPHGPWRLRLSVGC